MSKRINMGATTTILATFDLDNINEELSHRGMTKVDDPNTGAALLAAGIRSLDEFAATVVNLSKGDCDADTLKVFMTKAFPNHKIGDRHGSHYLSLARSGNIQGAIECRYAPAKATRRKSTAKAVDLSNVDEKQLRAMLRAAKDTPMAAIIEAELSSREVKAEANA